MMEFKQFPTHKCILFYIKDLGQFILTISATLDCIWKKKKKKICTIDHPLGLTIYTHFFIPSHIFLPCNIWLLLYTAE